MDAKRRRSRQNQWLLVIGSVFLLLATGWLGDALSGNCVFDGWYRCARINDVPTPAAIVSRLCLAGALFLVGAGWVYLASKRYWPVQVLHRSDVHPKRGLIVSMTSLNPVPTNEDGHLVVRQAATGMTVTLSGNLRGDIDEFTSQNFRWNGQQFLRSIEPHLASGRLEQLVLVGSSGAHGSYQSLEAAAKLLEIYAPRLTVHRHEQSVDFEDIQALQGAFRQWIETFQAAGLEEDDIVLDVTGGQKTSSIAAALTSLRWVGIEFQYVQTNVDHPHVIAFNAAVQLRENGALG